MVGAHWHRPPLPPSAPAFIGLSLEVRSTFSWFRFCDAMSNVSLLGTCE